VSEVLGLITVLGRKIRDTLSQKVKQELTNLRKYLHELADKTSAYIQRRLHEIGAAMNDPMSELKSFVFYWKSVKDA
jgi:hypothetical protein